MQLGMLQRNSVKKGVNFRKKSLLPLRTVELEISASWYVKRAAGDQARSVAEILVRWVEKKKKKGYFWISFTWCVRSSKDFFFLLLFFLTFYTPDQVPKTITLSKDTVIPVHSLQLPDLLTKTHICVGSHHYLGLSEASSTNWDKTETIYQRKKQEAVKTRSMWAITLPLAWMWAVFCR